MRLEERFSPMQLGKIGLVAAGLLYAGLPIVKIFKIHALHAGCTDFSFFVRVVLLASPFIVCLVAVAAVKSAIGRGIRTDVWPETKLVPLRLAVNSRALKRGVMAMPCLFLVAAVWSLSHHRDLTWFPYGIWYLFMFPMQMLNETRRELKPREQVSALNWRESSPIRSEHWGERQSVELAQP